jgi:hypothetical protein
MGATLIKSKKETHRYFAPKKHKEINERFLKYSDAVKLAEDINFNDYNRYHVIVNGTFFFGDFIEAFVVGYDIHVKNLTISTLSMNKNNVDSLANLIKGDYVDNINLILSDYFYGHEKHDLVPYIYETLDIDNKLQLSFAGTHCKVCLIESHNGRYYVFHGSANLRSSSNIEQVCMEENKDLYLWYFDIQKRISEEYKTINKSVRHQKLWQSLVKEVVEAEEVRVQEQVKDKHQDVEQVEQTDSVLMDVQARPRSKFKRIKF